MSGVNMVVLSGRIGGEPEEKVVNGKIVRSFRIANPRWDPKTSAEVADWYTVSVWDREAERSVKILKTGNNVLIEGRVSHREWTDQAGKKHWWFEIIAQRINLLSYSKREQETKRAEPSSAAAGSTKVARVSEEIYSDAVPF